MRRACSFVSLVVVVTVSAACASASSYSEVNSYGSNPTLPEPNGSLIPTVKVVNAVGWAEGEQPTPAAGTSVTAFARGLDHPRWLHVLPNGDVLVAETNAPPRPDDGKGLGADDAHVVDVGERAR